METSNKRARTPHSSIHLRGARSPENKPAPELCRSFITSSSGMRLPPSAPAEPPLSRCWCALAWPGTSLGSQASVMTEDPWLGDFQQGPGPLVAEGGTSCSQLVARRCLWGTGLIAAGQLPPALHRGVQSARPGDMGAKAQRWSMDSGSWGADKAPFRGPRPGDNGWARLSPLLHSSTQRLILQMGFPCQKLHSISPVTPIPCLTPECPFIHPVPINLSSKPPGCFYCQSPSPFSCPGKFLPWFPRRIERHTVKTSALLFTQGPLPGICLCETSMQQKGPGKIKQVVWAWQESWLGPGWAVLQAAGGYQKLLGPALGQHSEWPRASLSCEFWELPRAPSNTTGLPPFLLPPFRVQTSWSRSCKKSLPGAGAYFLFFLWDFLSCLCDQAAYGHLMLLPLCMSIWPPGPLVTAGWQIQGQATGERAAGSRTSLGMEGRIPLHSPHSARPGQEHSWPDLVEPVDRRMERSPPRARFLRKHAQAVRETITGGTRHSGLIGVRLSLAGPFRGSGRRGFVAAVLPEAWLG
eukprot:superscaffoldBa00001387_g10332